MKERKNFAFDGNISEEVLTNYLSRSVTAAGLIESKTMEDDIRAILHIGAKFLGRASGIWYMTMEDEKHFEMSKALADRIHQKDKDIILQACIFEWVVRGAERVKIPARVFEAFGLAPENRTFRLEDMLFKEEPKGYQYRREDETKDGGIPDLSRKEAQMWFYYRACAYIDCGFEALHMGQVHLYTANDKGFVKTASLFDMIRKYGQERARRHKVLLDAHTHGINIRGKLLFDYHAMPFTRFPILEGQEEDLILVREGCSEGGHNPNGWYKETMPYLMELDNWGGLAVENRADFKREELAFKDWWGYDQIAWFANQSEERRNLFLDYAYKWTQINNPNAYFQIPFRRMLGDAFLLLEGENGKEKQDFYQINSKSSACPMGFSQEETAKELFERGDALRKKAANPPLLLDYGAKEAYDKETGLKLPEKVVVYGSFQPYVGATANDSNSEITRMYYIGDNLYRLSLILPFAGEYDFSISTYGTLSATYQEDGYPRSGSSNKAYFRTHRENAVVVFSYEFISNKVSLEILE